MDAARQFPVSTIPKVASIGLKLLDGDDSHSIEQQHPPILRSLLEQRQDSTSITAETGTDRLFGHDTSVVDAADSTCVRALVAGRVAEVNIVSVVGNEATVEIVIEVW